MFAGIGCFFLDQWLWNVTWGWYYLPINMILFIFLLNFSAGMSLLRAVITSIFINVSSFTLFTSAVVGILIYAVGMEYITSMDDVFPPFVIWRPVLFLCLLYIVLQSCFLYLTRTWYKPSIKRLIFLLVISNLLSAFFAYKFVLMKLY